MSAARRRSLFEFLRRTFAIGGAALVFALSVFAASPELHHKLHSAASPVGDDSCAVVLFAGGVSLPVAIVAALPPLFELRTQPAASAEEIFLASPRYLRQPERGPPELG